MIWCDIGATPQHSTPPDQREGPVCVSKAALKIKLDRLSARGLAQAVQSLFEDRSDPILQIAEGAFS